MLKPNEIVNPNENQIEYYKNIIYSDSLTDDIIEKIVNQQQVELYAPDVILGEFPYSCATQYCQSVGYLITGDSRNNKTNKKSKYPIKNIIVRQDHEIDRA